MRSESYRRKIFFCKRTLLAIAMKVAVKITRKARTRVRRIFVARVHAAAAFFLFGRSIGRWYPSERSKKPFPRGLSGLGGGEEERGKCVIDDQGQSLSAMMEGRSLIGLIAGFPRARFSRNYARDYTDANNCCSRKKNGTFARCRFPQRAMCV